MTDKVTLVPPGTPINKQALALARQALDAWEQEAAQTQQAAQNDYLSITGFVIARLDAVWDLLGIDPQAYSKTHNRNPSWTGSVTYGYGPVFTFPTSVAVNGGIRITIGSQAYDFCGRTQVGGFTYLPDQPLQPEALAKHLHWAWEQAVKEDQAQRNRNFEQLAGQLKQFDPEHVRAPKQMIEFQTQLAALGPNDLPEPYEESKGKLSLLLEKAREKHNAQIAKQAQHLAAFQEIRKTAVRYLNELSLYRDACKAIAAELSARFAQPFTVYRVRYAPIGTCPGDEYDIFVQVYTITDPAEIVTRSPGATIRAISEGGDLSTLTIGAFVDAELYTQFDGTRDTDEYRRFHQNREIANTDIWAHFPPFMTHDDITNVMRTLTLPVPPAPFHQMVRQATGALISLYKMQDPEKWPNCDLGKLPLDTIRIVGPETEPETVEPDPDIPF